MSAALQASCESVKETPFSVIAELIKNCIAGRWEVYSWNGRNLYSSYNRRKGQPFTTSTRSRLRGDTIAAFVLRVQKLLIKRHKMFSCRALKLCLREWSFGSTCCIQHRGCWRCNAHVILMEWNWSWLIIYSWGSYTIVMLMTISLCCAVCRIHKLTSFVIVTLQHVYSRSCTCCDM